MIFNLSRAVAAFGFHPKRCERPLAPLPLIGTGALINNSQGDGTPFFLTARHHFLFGGRGVRLGSYPSFEAVWDYTGAALKSTSRAEVLTSLPRSRGAVLLACDEDADAALLRLEEIPPGRTFLGWRISEVEESELHRLSHPYGSPQTYSRHRGLEPLKTAKGSPLPSAPKCVSLSSSRFYQTLFEGILGPGSSGAPMVTSDRCIVGQLWGIYEKDGIAYALDGAFSQAYLRLRQWLDPLGMGEAPELLQKSCSVARKEARRELRVGGCLP
jgi:hypothetical protein